MWEKKLWKIFANQFRKIIKIEKERGKKTMKVKRFIIEYANSKIDQYEKLKKEFRPSRKLKTS